jgi:hypothetical protein
MKITPIDELRPEHIGQIVSAQYIPRDPEDETGDTLKTDKMTKHVGILQTFTIDKDVPRRSFLRFQGEGTYMLAPRSGDRVELYLHTHEDTKPSESEEDGTLLEIFPHELKEGDWVELGTDFYSINTLYHELESASMATRWKLELRNKNRSNSSTIDVLSMTLSSETRIRIKRYRRHV